MLRVFYAMHDSKTPAIAGFWTMAATVAGNYLVLAVLPAGQVVIGMAAVYGITSVLSAALAENGCCGRWAAWTAAKWYAA